MASIKRPEGILKEALVTKQGGRIKTWKQRWCVLNDAGLFYYKPPKNLTIRDNTRYANLQGTIPTRDITNVDIAHEEKKRHCFKVVTRERTYMICSSDDDQMLNWIKAIRLVMEKQITRRSSATSSVSSSPRNSTGSTSHTLEKKTSSEPNIRVSKEFTTKTKEELEILLENLDSRMNFEIETFLRQTEKEQMAILTELMTREISTVKEKYFLEQEDIKKELAATEGNIE